ncbi:hypothetical protein C8R43DRAFT_1141396 [Mycena crocata]|nr:hypothetical protein C8R43DRAFT_1141396 [Mycena crocata]
MSDSTAPQRRRVFIACLNCRKRKIKCMTDDTEQQPCDSEGSSTGKIERRTVTLIVELSGRIVSSLKYQLERGVWNPSSASCNSSPIRAIRQGSV